jgi:hypothetical protein
MYLRLQGSDVGAVARDTAGHLATATSTGGLTGKRWRRVGDSPLIGAGTWPIGLLRRRPGERVFLALLERPTPAGRHTLTRRAGAGLASPAGGRGALRHPTGYLPASSWQAGEAAVSIGALAEPVPA